MDGRRCKQRTRALPGDGNHYWLFDTDEANASRNRGVQQEAGQSQVENEGESVGQSPVGNPKKRQKTMMDNKDMKMNKDESSSQSTQVSKSEADLTKDGMDQEMEDVGL
ncbi:hypothetical protein EG329_012226 [Mollisiaceae sp. DMI_Dod_QoI]|nr:hypothetical protein EG329_012226 [Helotiales sp. DMI_Dod_QoI]